MAVSKNSPPDKRFDHLVSLISSPRFLQKRGLGNEVPFFICPFDPKEAVEMADTVRRLATYLAEQGVTVLCLNLYDLCIELLEERAILDRVLEAEATMPKAQFRELLQGVLDPETHLVPKIGQRLKSESFDVLFLTGVGEVYPFVRSHNVLNNLQSTAKEQPTVLFFPGEYRHSLESGASLDLFGRLHDDKYYRAFNIYEIEV